MSCTSCIQSSRIALRRVFLASPIEPSSSSQLQRLTPSRHTRLPVAFTSQHPRFFTGIRKTPIGGDSNDLQSPPRRPPFNPRDPLTNPSVQAPTHDSRSVKAHKQKGSKENGSSPASLPRDDEIRSVSDYIVLRREDGHLTEPRALSSVLAEASLRDETVVTIVLPRPGQTKGIKYPICVVLDRASYEESEAQRISEEAEKAKGERKAKKGMKELEINWATAPHDLEHKMRKFREFLQKGLRVEMLLLRRSKKTHRTATREEVEELIRRVREEAASVPGASETKPASGTPGERLQLFFQGPQ